jgi:TolB-like protein
MKRCPQCNLRHDDALSYCRVHGTPLVPDAVALESETAALPPAPASGGFATQVLERPPSIAVLPFANMSSDPENEYFCDGLAEELSNALAKVEGLKVAARTSAFSFKGTNRGVGEIGHALNVSSVLEGSVRKSGSRLRITVKLVNAADGYHLWSEKYDRELKDIFDVQDEITLAVVGALKVRLLGEEKAAVLKRYTDDAEAYQLYLRGNYHLYKFTPDDLRRAIGCFDEAIAKDPNYALAQNGLAGAYSIAADFGDGAAAARWEASARKAVALDPALSEAHAMLAVHAFWNRRDVTGAHGEFTRALELNPNSAIARHYYSWFLIATGRFDEAQEHLRRALELDPLSL